MGGAEEIHVVNYGMGNLGSIANMFRRLGAGVVIADEPSALKHAEKIVLPGVGNFGKGMENICGRGFRDALEDGRARGAWVLGICLGMQLMTEYGEEGECSGLGWIGGDAKSFRTRLGERSPRLKLPHMGWNVADRVGGFAPCSGLAARSRFYFVHSYYVDLASPSDVLYEAEYGFRFCAGFAKERLIGVQFHPEKSHRYGMEFMRNFLDLKT